MASVSTSKEGVAYVYLHKGGMASLSLVSRLYMHVKRGVASVSQAKGVWPLCLQVKEVWPLCL